MTFRSFSRADPLGAQLVKLGLGHVAHVVVERPAQHLLGLFGLLLGLFVLAELGDDLGQVAVLLVDAPVFVHVVDQVRVGHAPLQLLVEFFDFG